MFLYYIIISIILCILVFHGYNKVRHKFWMTQPIFYRYNLTNWFRTNRICSTDRPIDTLYLNFINNVVTHITDTNSPIIIDNIYVNETERASNYYEDIVKLINKYPYFNKELNNGNKKSIVIERKLSKDKLKCSLMNHDYNAIVTMNKRSLYKTDTSTSNILSIDTVMGVIISIPLYCRFETKGIADMLPIYYSAIYYDPREIQDRQIIELLQTHNYKIYDDWDRALMRQIDYKNNGDEVTRTVDEEMFELAGGANERIKKGMKRQTREIMRNSNKSKIINKSATMNPYEENCLNITKNKEKIYTSIYKYTGSSIPKMIVPFVVYHRFYIPISSQPSQDWHKIEYRFHQSIQLIKIGTENITLLYEFLESCYEGLNTNTFTQSHKSHKLYKYKLPFKCVILPSLRHIFHMIKQQLCSIYILLQKNTIVTSNGVIGNDNTNILSIYVFSNSDDTVSNELSIDKRHTIYLTTSVMYSSGIDGDGKNLGVSSFIYGFINALKLEMKKREIGCVGIDTLSHNKPLIDFFIVNTKPLMVEKNGLIFYNYICNTLSPEHVMIMN
jgi:hypothetical protein